MHLITVTGSFQHPRSSSNAAPTLPARPRTAPAQPQLLPDLEPPYHVILHDDDDHTHRYVVNMLMNIFGYEEALGFKMACEVNESGRSIVATCHKELAELRVEQILEYEEDPPDKESFGPMKASMEPAA